MRCIFKADPCTDRSHLRGQPSLPQEIHGVRIHKGQSCGKRSNRPVNRSHLLCQLIRVLRFDLSFKFVWGAVRRTLGPPESALSQRPTWCHTHTYLFFSKKGFVCEEHGLHNSDVNAAQPTQNHLLYQTLIVIPVTQYSLQPV